MMTSLAEFLRQLLRVVKERAWAGIDLDDIIDDKQCYVLEFYLKNIFENDEKLLKVFAKVESHFEIKSKMLKKSTKNLTKNWRVLFRFDDFLVSYLCKFRFFWFLTKVKHFQVLFQYFRCFIRKKPLYAKNTQKEPKYLNICSKLVNFSLLLSLRPRASNSKNFVSKKQRNQNNEKSGRNSRQKATFP